MYFCNLEFKKGGGGTLQQCKTLPRLACTIIL